MHISVGCLAGARYCEPVSTTSQSPRMHARLAKECAIVSTWHSLANVRDIAMLPGAGQAPVADTTSVLNGIASKQLKDVNRSAFG